ncbi:efflux RND transporter periplasmic adaptor subunit [Candidatus Gottesmanbacteria bacterium]|nr:efflux RND transporter periplasmic adaptor subunit [Candidatus Gottesmanbacteria bacterium]
MNLSGKIASDQVIKLKFSISGTVSSVNTTTGKSVKKGELLASLNQKELQAYLDRSLKYYDSQRAEFEEKQKKGIGDFERIKIQSELDISVKNVEIAKTNLEATNLYSPINGIVVEMDPIAPGVNIAPTNFVITVLNPDSYYFDAEVKEENLNDLKVDDYAEISLKAFKDKVYKGRVAAIGITPSKDGIYPVKIVLEEKTDLRLGLSGTVELKQSV